MWFWNHSTHCGPAVKQLDHLVLLVSYIMCLPACVWWLQLLDDLASIGLLLAPVVQVQSKRNHRSIVGLLIRAGLGRGGDRGAAATWRQQRMTNKGQNLSGREVFVPLEQHINVVSDSFTCTWYIIFITFQSQSFRRV